MSKIQSKAEYEWSMGNGQCPVCYGVSPKWAHSKPLGVRNCGHEPVCWLAADIEGALYREVDRDDPESRDKKNWTPEYHKRLEGLRGCFDPLDASQRESIAELRAWLDRGKKKSTALFGIARKTSKCAGHGDYIEHLELQGKDPYAPFPPLLFSTREKAEETIAANEALYWGCEVVEIQPDK